VEKIGCTAALWVSTCASLWIVGCGGGMSTVVTPPVKTTPAVSVTPSASSITTAQSLTVAISVSGSPQPTGSVTLSSGSYSSAATTLSSGSASIVINAGTLAAGNDTLTATYTPDAGSSSTYNGASGAASVNVTAPVKITPVVTVTPSASSITSAQALTVTVAVSGGTGNPTPTGSVTLTSGSYTSGAMTLAGGGATIAVPAGSLATGSDTLTVNYSPDAASSPTYNGASGMASVNVRAPTKITPVVTVTPSASSITSAQALTVTVAVSGGTGNLAPTGSVTLTSGSYTSAAMTLAGGGATIAVPAGSLATGSDTLTVTYSPDAASSTTYNGASGMAAVTVTGATTYVLTVNSAAPSSGVSINVSPLDNNGKGVGTTTFTRTYNAGASVTLSAPLSDGSYSFVSWSGCTPVSGAPGNCVVTVNANTAVTATYNQQGISSITVTPNSAVTIGTQQQFTATVNGAGSFSTAVTWSVTTGYISTTGLYNTPYPAPATVTVTATSVSTPSISGSVTVALDLAASTAGPALTVDAGNQTHAINPYIYGMDAYTLNPVTAKAVNLTVDRWGGDATSRYNYQLDVTNSASDWYFSNSVGATGLEATGQFNEQVISDAQVGAKTLGTVPVLGWVAKDGTSCSFPSSLYPDQVEFEPYHPECGNGLYPQGVNGCTNAGGCNITGNDPTLADQAEGPSWAGGWVSYLVGRFGNAKNGGVSIYDLDNEPGWWDAVHRDVHPVASTYDEVTNNGIATAEAIKTADSTAEVSGPVIDDWWNYFYSKKDIENGWNSGPCYQPWSGPIDRQAHGGVPMIEYYLQQFKAASDTYGARLLDYVDMHTYFAADNSGLTTAGDTQEQEARVNSTRVFWDPTYTDPNLPQPNYSANPASQSCTVPLQAPQLITMAQTWVANDYPGTKVAFTEYNWGGQENMNGAVAQADLLGIFGQYGLDLAALWGPPDPATQAPGLLAFEMYRNYDGKNSMFGDTALKSSSANQGVLSVYGAERAADGSVTVMVINKTYGPLTSTLSLENFSSSSGAAQVFLLSDANSNAIVAQPNAKVTPPAGSGTTSTITSTFPAQSITLIVAPK